MTIGEEGGEEEEMQYGSRKTSQYCPVEVTYVIESNDIQSRGDFLQNQIHSWSKCVLKEFQSGRRPTT